MIQADTQTDMHNKRKSNKVKLINTLKFSLWTLSKCNTCLSNPDLTENKQTYYDFKPLLLPVCGISRLHERRRTSAAWWRPLSTVITHVVTEKANEYVLGEGRAFLLVCEGIIQHSIMYNWNRNRNTDCNVTVHSSVRPIVKCVQRCACARARAAVPAHIMVCVPVTINGSPL